MAIMARWGLIGASDIAETRMIPAMRAQPGSSVAGVVSSDAARGRAFAERTHLKRAYDTLEELLADDSIDAVYISTKNDSHRAQTVAAARAGKHVLCEKPLALTVADALEMERECAEAGVVLATNHHLRNAATHRTVRALIQDGRIGHPLAARVFHAVHLPERLRGWRIDDPAGGGVILDITVHDADTLRFDLDDDPVAVVAMTASQGMAHDGLPDSVMGVIRFRSGLLAQFHDAFTIAHTRTGFEVHGTEASIRVTEAMTQEPDGEVVLQRGADAESIDIGEFEDLYVRSVRLFESAARGEGQPAATARDGVWSLAVALAVSEAASTGQTVPVRADRTVLPHA
jgi:1,5-anhydro-D-fructose reductase (1,5-anhydro-D-mannitol-forming)